MSANAQNIIVLQAGESTINIWPNHGGILNNWVVHTPNEQLELIDGYISTQQFESHVEEAGFRSCKLSPFACRMHLGNYTFHNQGYTIEKFYIGNSALHGILYDAAYKVLHTQQTPTESVATLEYQYTGTDAGYPFTYTIQLVYTLSYTNVITITTTVTNNHNAPIPITDGWHPYFSLGGSVDELHLQIAANEMVVFNELLVPTGEIVAETRFQEPTSMAGVALDNCFVLNPTRSTAACQLLHKAKGYSLTIDAGKSYPFLQIYTPPHRKSIAIENLSATPDSFNNKMGLLELAAGETAVFTCSYAFALTSQL